MEWSDDDIYERARMYVSHRGLDLLEPWLGFGKDGTVWSSDRATAIKTFRRYGTAAFESELAVYHRLREREVVDMLGHRVPQLIASDASLMVIEMTIVQAPFILDFAGAQLDRPFDFSDDALERWRADRIEEFGEERWNHVQRLLWRFESLGIYLHDISPRNIAFAPEQPR